MECVPSGFGGLNQFKKKWNVLRKHSLHGENSSVGFIEAGHQW